MRRAEQVKFVVLPVTPEELRVLDAIRAAMQCSSRPNVLRVLVSQCADEMGISINGEFTEMPVTSGAYHKRQRELGAQP